MDMNPIPAKGPVNEDVSAVVFSEDGNIANPSNNIFAVEHHSSFLPS
jgi:hypothetical protein